MTTHPYHNSDLESPPAVLPPATTVPAIHTDGGAVVQGNITVGGDFVGRDQINIAGDLVQHIHHSTVTLANSPFQAPRLEAALIARQQEQEQIQKWLLYNEQVCVITGMAGIGKSYLATYMAHKLRGEFPDGVLWARIPESELGHESSITDSLLPILGTFAEAYGRDVSQYSDVESRARVVRELLATKRALVVLDNLQSSQQLDFLLPNTEKCATLITTRYSRTVPARFRESIVSLQAFTIEDGVDLLKSLVDTRRIEEGVAGAQRLVQFVGGLPLALRIIGAAMNEADYLSTEEYGTLLAAEEERLSQLQDWQDISRNVRASFELSYRRLENAAIQQLFATLSLFDGESFSIDAIVAVSGSLSSTQIKVHMGRLTGLSLVEIFTVSDEQVEQSATMGKLPSGLLERYRLHSLLKLFAQEKFVGDRIVVRQRQIDYYITLAQRYRAESYQLLDIEWSNFDHILTWLTTQNWWMQAIQIISDLTYLHLGVAGFFDARGYWQRGEALCNQALATLPNSDDALRRAELQLKLGIFALRQAAYEQAAQHLHATFVVLTQVQANLDAAIYEAYACEAMAQILIVTTQDLSAPLNLCERARQKLQKFNTESARHTEGYVSIRHATILAQHGNDLIGARQEIELALEQLLPKPATAAQVSAFISLGNVYDIEGNPSEAKNQWQKGIIAAQKIGDSRRLADLWFNLARQADEQGQFTEAIQDYQQALHVYVRIGDVDGEGYTCNNLAYSYLVQQNNIKEALPYLERAETLVQKYGFTILNLQTKVNRVYWHLHNEDYTVAQDILEEAWVLSQVIDYTDPQAEILRLQAIIALYNQNYNDALTLVSDSIEAAVDVDLEAGISWRIKGNIYQTLGKYAEAGFAYQRSSEQLIPYPFERARTLLALGEHYIHQQNLIQGHQALVNAKEIFIAFQSSPEYELTEKLLTQCE